LPMCLCAFFISCFRALSSSCERLALRFCAAVRAESFVV
jgi:hypothetical protein